MKDQPTTPASGTAAGLSVATGSAPFYRRRPTEDLGEYYIRHVDALTREGMFTKSCIAAELAVRDLAIDRLRASLTEACELWEHRGSRTWWKATDPHLADLLDKWNATLGRQQPEEMRPPNNEASQPGRTDHGKPNDSRD